MSSNNYKFGVEIPEAVALAMLQEYKDNTNKLQITTGEDGVNNTIDLRSLIIEKSDLEELVNNPDASHFAALFAVSYDDLGKDPSSQDFTIILAPVKANGEIILDNVYNKFSPCPDQCGGYQLDLDSILD